MHRFSRRLRANLRYLRRPLRGFLPLLAGSATLLLVGGLCFHAFYDREPLTLLESLYMTYSLIFMELPYPYSDRPVLQIFYWGLPLLGLVVVLDGVVRFGYHVFRRETTSAEWINAMTHSMRNHVILVGLGNLGLRVLQQLIDLGEDIVVLDRDPQNPNHAFAHKHRIPVLVGDSRQDGVVDDLNAQQARSIILATSDDLANLEMALDARKANPSIRVVLRMFDQELASKIKESFGIPLSFSTSAIAAPLFATSSIDKSIVNSFYVGERLQVVADLTVRGDSQLAGRTPGELQREHHVVVLTHVRGEERRFHPPPELRLERGDRVTVQTEPRTLRQLHEWNGDEQPY